MLGVLSGIPTNITNPFKDISLDDTYSRFNRIYLFGICLISGVVVSVTDYTGEDQYIKINDKCKSSRILLHPYFFTLVVDKTAKNLPNKVAHFRIHHQSLLQNQVILNNW